MFYQNDFGTEIFICGQIIGEPYDNEKSALLDTNARNVKKVVIVWTFII